MSAFTSGPPAAAPAAPPRSGWRFPGFFWGANAAELFERAAYYGVFIGLVVYLSQNYGFTDVEAGYVAAYFSSFISLMPTFCGAWADRMGFRGALALAFGLLAAGYLMLGGFGVPGAMDALGSGGVRAGAVGGLTVILLGGAFVKAVISGTVAKSSTEATRARAFSIFYQVVNIGSFLGKTAAAPLRQELGLEYVSFFSAALALGGLFTVLLFYRGVPAPATRKTTLEVVQALGRVLKNGRFLGLILIVAGFWTIQGQLYAAMPKYVLRTVGPEARPEWLANVNPLMVVLLVVPITHLARRLKPVTSMAIALALIPFSALTVAFAPWLREVAGSEIVLFGAAFHPVTVTLIVGIALQGIAECFLSPRYLEFASRQAPPGEEGLYMGFSHLHTFFAWFLGFVLSGYLLDAFCPDPETLPAATRAAWQHAIATGGPLPAVYDQAHYLWYVFAAIGVVSFLMLLAYKVITERTDRRRA